MENAPPETDARRAAARALDAALDAPVLVIGSLPPDGRDLDLLVRDVASLESSLAAAGFRRDGEGWTGPAGYAVEPVPAERWALPGAELDALFAAARTIDGYAN